MLLRYSRPSLIKEGQIRFQANRGGFFQLPTSSLPTALADGVMKSEQTQFQTIPDHSQQPIALAQRETPIKNNASLSPPTLPDLGMVISATRFTNSLSLPLQTNHKKMQVTQFFRKPYDFHFSIEKLFRQINPIINQSKNIRSYTSRFHSRGLLTRLKMILEARKQSADVNHITGDIHFIAFGLQKKNTILTIHDLGFTKHPNPLARFILWLFWIYLPVKRVAAITTISQASKDDIIKYARCKSEKVRIIPNFVPQEIQYSAKKFNHEKPIILQIGTKFNKNLERTIRALEGINCHLRIIGKLTPTHIELLQTRKIDYSNDSRITDKQLIEEYQNCDLVTFCSTLEGFGMVILEAQATGRPVVTSNLSSMPEVAGDGACLVNPYEISSIRTGVIKVIKDESYRKFLMEKGFKNCKRYTLPSVAKQYYQLYQEVHEKAHS